MKISALIDYFSKVKLEFFKVVWLKPQELSRLLATVLITTILTACFFAVIDMIVKNIIMKIIFM